MGKLVYAEQYDELLDLTTFVSFRAYHQIWSDEDIPYWIDTFTNWVLGTPKFSPEWDRFFEWWNSLSKKEIDAIVAKYMISAKELGYD